MNNHWRRSHRLLAPAQRMIGAGVYETRAVVPGLGRAPWVDETARAFWLFGRV